MEIKKIHDILIKRIREYFKNSSFKKAVIGLSGGIDSSVSATLVSKAISNKNITALLMPDIGLSSMEHYKHAKEIVEMSKMPYFVAPINNFLRPFSKIYWKESEFAKMNAKARMRAVILYHFANSHNALVIGTSNKTELRLGYFTKYGDGAIDIEVIGDLWKTEVVELARYLKIPQEIIIKKPTAELYHGHTDEDELGGSYKEIDRILIEMDIGKTPKGKLAERIKKLVDANKHKTLPIPIIKKI